ncbi:hypothetical protein BDW71DRAFT_188543 [Aspergillus fruticulosus]
MASGDKTLSHIPGPKFGMVRSKPVVEQQPAVSGDESQLKDSIEDFDWSQLESSYIQIMEQHEKSEEELRDHITKLLQVFTAWSQTTVVHDEIRALKRLVVYFGE